MDPTDPTEFVGQLSQLSSLEQLMSLREGMELMAVAQTAGTSANVVSFVGRNITFRGDSLTFDGGGKPTDIGIQLDGKAAEVTLTIKDSEGKEVRVLSLGEHDTGKHMIPFDGKDKDGKPLADGQYSVTISAVDHTGATVKASARKDGKVVGVSYDNGYPELVLEGGQRIALGKVLEVTDDDPPTSSDSTSTTRQREE